MTTFLVRRASTPLVWVLGLLFGLTPQWLMAQAAPKLVVRNATIFSMAAAQKEPFVGYIAVGSDGRIVAVGAGEPPAELKAQTVWDAHGHWVMPGFISAHSHLWQSAYRGLAADQTLLGDDLRRMLPRIRAPTLLIWGNNDSITPPFVGQEFKRLIPNSELHFIDKCGHAPMMETPDEFNAILLKFLRKLNEPAAVA